MSGRCLGDVWDEWRFEPDAAASVHAQPRANNARERQPTYSFQARYYATMPPIRRLRPLRRLPARLYNCGDDAGATSPSREIRMIFVPPSQHGDGERPAGPILFILLLVAVVAGVSFYRKSGGEFSIEGFDPGPVMWIIGSLGVSLAVVAGVVAVQKGATRNREPSTDDRLAAMETQLAEIRQAMDTQLDSMSRKLEDAARAAPTRRERDR